MKWIFSLSVFFFFFSFVSSASAQHKNAKQVCLDIYKDIESTMKTYKCTWNLVPVKVVGPTKVSCSPGTCYECSGDFTCKMGKNPNNDDFFISSTKCIHHLKECGEIKQECRLSILKYEKAKCDAL